MTEVCEFPVVKQDLTLDEVMSLVKRKNPQTGIILYEDEDGDVCYLHFGNLSRKDALWFAEKLKIEALWEEEHEYE